MNTPFAVTVNGTYTAHEIPPRCRKPRPVTYDTSTVTTIDAVSCEAAPIAFRVSKVIPAQVTEIRVHDGRLYSPYKPGPRQEGPTIPGDSSFPSEIDARHHLSGHLFAGTVSNAEEFAAAVGDHFAPYLIIDGTVWIETDEPAYLVTTFGLGGINGSTGLMVGSCMDHGGHLFRADEFEAALAHAIEVAEGRGDDASRYREDGERSRAIEVLVPEAVTLVTVPPTPREVSDLRFDYSRARGRLRDARTPDEETEAFDEVVRLRRAVISHGYPPLASDARPYEARGLRLEA